MNQNQTILAHLRRGESITGIEALKKYKCFRLPARIGDIEGKGGRAGMLKIDEEVKRTKVTQNGATFTTYILGKK